MKINSNKNKLFFNDKLFNLINKNKSKLFLFSENT